MGFYEVGSRMVVQYHRESRRPLSEKEAKKIPMHDLFSMYVDLIVDNVPDGIKNILGFVPLDERMLGTVFDDGRYDEIDKFGARIILPKPDILLSTKLAALPNRAKDHKRYKDIADIYALIWYSGMDLVEMKAGVLRHVPQARIEKVLLGIGDADYEGAAAAIGATTDDVRNVIRGFAGPGIPGPADADGGGRWPIPKSVGYETFIGIPKALHRQRADSKPISADRLARLTSISKRTTEGNLAFLTSVGIVERRGSRSYVLTPLGSAYARAHAAGDGGASIKDASLDMITKSHLRSLSDILDTGNPERDEIYAWIKARGGYPDGHGPGRMCPPAGIGARTLLRIFADAGLVPVEMTGESGSAQHGPKPAGGGQNGRDTAPGTCETPHPARDSAPLGRVSVRGVGSVDINDLDALDIAESYLRLLRKKIKDTQDR